VGAKLIGVNNRDLHTFTVDPTRTTVLAEMIQSKKDEIVLVALSGIRGREDVLPYLGAGAAGVLVGEHLMKATDKKQFINSLKGISPSIPVAPSSLLSSSTVTKTSGSPAPRVKICGITNVEDALLAAKAGASFLGFIFAPSPRNVSKEKVIEIVTAVRSHYSTTQSKPAIHRISKPLDFTYISTQAAIDSALSESSCPLFVGVFSNESYLTINETVEACGLDLVQFHGSEIPRVHAPLVSVPVIKACHVLPETTAPEMISTIQRSEGYLCAWLLDTGVKGLVQQGGSGVPFDWEKARSVNEAVRGVGVWMAGGLTPDNVGIAVEKVKPFCVDVCSGVEKTKGLKDHGKIFKFLTAVTKNQ
jgi:anthranilate synthase / indole-3-glycerol phosphate synthase / phosphoribosylanthranilate isomerase